MKWVWRIVFAVSASGAIAEGHFLEQAEGALSNAQIFNNYSVEGAQETLAVPVETELDQSSMDVPALEEAGTLATTGDTTEGKTFQVMSENATEWSIEAASPSMLEFADGIVADPHALIEEGFFSASPQDECTVTDFEEAPVFTRSCQRDRDVYASIATSRLDITVIRTEQYQCHLIGSGVSCDELDALSFCAATDTTCTEQDIDGNCIEEVATYTCSSDAPMSIASPQTGVTTWDSPVFTWNTSYDAGFSAPNCSEIETTCSAGASIEEVNGLLVPVDCSEEQTTYECGATTYTSDGCAEFEADASCSLVSSACFFEGPDGTCGGYEDTYQCGSEAGTEFSAHCEDVNVCVGDVCQSVPQDTNQDLPLGLAAVELLNTLADEWGESPATVSFVGGEIVVTPGELAYFDSDENYCRIGFLSLYDCCVDNGWALGVFTECREHELALIVAQEADRTVYIGTSCRRKALFFCLERSRDYCVFSGAVAKEVNLQAQRQLNGTFECRGLTHAELEQVDWSQIDLTSVFSEVLSKASLPDGGELTSLIQSNTEALAPTVVDTYE